MVNKHRFIGIVIVLTIAISSLLALLAPATVHAAVTGTVIDRAHIKIGTRLFVDSDIDDDFSYIEQDPTDRCADEIYGFDNDDLRGKNVPSSAKIKISTPKPNNNSDCNNNDDTINFTSAANFRKAFLWVDANTITGADGRITFERDGSTDTFKDANSEDRCVDTLVIGAGNTTATLQEREFEEDGNHEYDWYPFSISDRKENSNSGCWESDKVSGIELAGTPTTGNEAGVTGGSGVGSGQEAPSCESEGGEWSWILCPALRMASNAMEKLDEAIQRLLSVPASYYDDPDLEAAWRNIRNIAYIILIPVMLVMVIGTALGFEFISAYTVKKALPRLLIAVLFMTLSFELTKFLIVLTNDVSQGIQGLIISSFTASGRGDITLASLFDPGGGSGAVFTGSVAGGLIVAAGLLPVVLSYLFVATISLFVALLALSLRQMLLIMFMILAPLAIVAWIFPGNDKLWKLWWGSFSKLLLLFPLIMALIGSGKAFAALVQNTNSDLFSTILKLTAYIGPYLFIPAMFKFAGGIFATVSGMANDRSKGLFDRQKKFRAQKYGEGWERAKSQNYFKGGTEGSLRDRLNKGVQGAALINRAGANPLRMRGKLGAATSDAAIAGREKMLEDNDYTWKGNDDLNKAAYQSNNESDLRRLLVKSGNYANTPAGKANMERDIAKVERLRRKYGSSAFRQATWLQSAAGGTTHDTGPGSDNVWQGAASVAGNDDAILADLVAKGRGVLMNAGRVDEGGAGWMDTFRIARQFRDNPGYTADQGRADLAKRVYDAQGGAILVHSSMKAGAVENLAPEMLRTVDTAINSGDTKAAAQSLASLSAVYDGLAGSSPEKARIMADKVMSQEFDIATLTPDMKQLLGPALLYRDPTTGAMASRTTGKITMQQAIEGVRSSENNGEFLQMRREYQSQIASLQAQQVQQQGPGGPQTQPPTTINQTP